MKMPNRKLFIEISYDDERDAILANNYIQTILTVGQPENYGEWSNLYSYLPENDGARKIIGRFKIVSLGQ